MRFSVIIPARNEAKRIGACLDSIHAACQPYAGQIEIIVVLNRCTDSTGDIALKHGARIVHDDHKNLAKIRNAGARQAVGDILVTIDADSRMAPNMFEQIDKALSSGQYIGGGVPVRPERWSVGIFLTGLILLCMLPGLSAGLFWCYRKDFQDLGGFNESLLVGEDVDFAKRLRAYGKHKRKRFGTLWRTHIVTSCRKFDTFGDWFCVKRPWLLWQGVRGIDSGYSDKIFYEYHR
jgi:glycosyltransferase involved in cell wall biosynthesis